MRKRFIQLPGTDLPPDEFVSLVGCMGYVSSEKSRELLDKHHIFICVLEPDSGRLYDCAVKTLLTHEAEMQVCFLREDCPVDHWPKFGFSANAELDYRDLQVHQADFRSVGRHTLSDELSALAMRCDRVEVFGRVDGKGMRIQHIHRNSGEPVGVSRPNCTNQDGAVVFYNDRRTGVAAERVFALLKFEVQGL
jgi:hypothetical protein